MDSSFESKTQNINIRMTRKPTSDNIVLNLFTTSSKIFLIGSGKHRNTEQPFTEADESFIFKI